MSSTPTHIGRQFSIRDLMITMSIVAISLVVIPLAPFFGVTAAGISLFSVFAIPRIKAARPSPTFLLVLCSLLVPVEFACGLLAYHTLGEISGAMVRMSVLLNLSFLGAYAMGSRRIAMVGVLVLALCIVPYHTWLGIRWWLIHQEATAIVDFAERTKVATGKFPVDLTMHEYRHPSIKRYIRYRPRSQTFRVRYHVGTTSTSHWYDHGGQWQYYPD
jgi:hypothetical protein